MKIKIIVDGETATANLFDTPTGRDFASLLPLSLTLEDYANIERISNLPRRLSTAQAPDSMTPGPETSPSMRSGATKRLLPGADRTPVH